MLNLYYLFIFTVITNFNNLSLLSDPVNPNCEEGGYNCSASCDTALNQDDEYIEICSCQKGFDLNAASKRCIDINECTTGSPCSFNCTNLPGSFNCNCPENYTINPSNQTDCISIESKSMSNSSENELLSNEIKWTGNNTQDYVQKNQNETDDKNNNTSEMLLNATFINKIFTETDSNLELNLTFTNITQFNNFTIEVLPNLTNFNKNEKNLNETLELLDDSKNALEYYFPLHSNNYTENICLFGYYFLLPELICVKIWDNCSNNNYACKPNCLSIARIPYCFCPDSYSFNQTTNVCILNICSNKTCQYQCHSDYFGANCSCPSGFIIDDYEKCKDINECLTQDICGSSLYCVNTIGGFECVTRIFTFIENIDENFCLDVTNQTTLLGGYAVETSIITTNGKFSEVKFCHDGKVVFGANGVCNNNKMTNPNELYLLDNKIISFRNNFTTTKSGYYYCRYPSSVLSLLSINAEENKNGNVNEFSDIFIWKDVFTVDSLASKNLTIFSMAVFLIKKSFYTNISVIYSRGVNATINLQNAENLNGYLKLYEKNMSQVVQYICDYCENHNIQLGTLQPSTQLFKCINWTINQPSYNFYIPKKMTYSCPMDLYQALGDLSFSFIQKIVDSKNTTCFFKQFMEGEFLATVQCCYHEQGHFIMFNSNNKSFKSLIHYSFNCDPSQWLLKNDERLSIVALCCGLDDSDLCTYVNSVQLSMDNFDYLPSRLSLTYGDPHFITIDGNEFTFNGIGDFIAIQSNNCWTGIPFRVDYRLERISIDGSNNYLSNATVVSAVAILLNGTVSSFSAFETLQLHLDNNKFLGSDNIYLIVNGVNYDWSMFNHKKIANYDMLKVTKDPKTLEKIDALLIINKDGNGFFAQIFSTYLIVNLIISQKMYGCNEGLLGSVDRDVLNDYTPRGGIQIPLNSNEQSIYSNFGLTWRDHNSLLSTLYAISIDQSWQPAFIDSFDVNQMDSNLYQAALILCAAKSILCIYDIAQTGNLNISRDSIKSVNTFNEILDNLKNVPPIITRVVDSLNQEIFYVDVFYDAIVRGQIVLNNYNGLTYDSNYPNINFTINGEFVWRFTSSLIDSPLIFTVTNQFNKSALISIPLYVCSCSNNGNCFQSILTAERIYPDVYRKKCQCSFKFYGDQCQYQIDPCSTPLNTCFLASSCSFMNNTIICLSCPVGYVGDGHICLKTSLCDTNPSLCSNLRISSGLSIGLSIGFVGFACIFTLSVFVIKHFYLKYYKVPKLNVLQLTVPS